MISPEPSSPSASSLSALPTRYRRGVGIMLINRHKQVFMGQRRDIASAWQMPQGGVEKDEPFLDAALRELYEETGIHKVKILHKSKTWLQYDLPDHLVGKLWKGQFKGQKQKWFLMLFLGDDEEDINLKVHKYQEFQNWQWVNLEDLETLVVSFRKQVYADLIAEFSPIIHSLSPKIFTPPLVKTKAALAQKIIAPPS